MLVLDVDRLKSLNDSYGHLTGADAVRTVGRLIARHTPPRAVACRFGGDEFVIAIPNCPMAQGLDIAELLRGSVSEEQPVLAARSFPSGTLSISIGAASRRVERMRILWRLAKNHSARPTRPYIGLKRWDGTA